MCQRQKKSNLQFPENDIQQLDPLCPVQCLFPQRSAALYSLMHSVSLHEKSG